MNTTITQNSLYQTLPGIYTDNDDPKVELISDYLLGKKIGLCVTGGVAAMETPKIARMLRRYGAEVTAYVTRAGLSFTTKDGLEWATEKPVITKLSGSAEHLCKNHALLVAPATLNTINKMMYGIADNPVTTLIASALGRGTPILIAPTMHESLYNNPFLMDSLRRSTQYNIKVIEPRISEGKAKIPRLENLVAHVCHELSDHPIKGKRILITGGPTPAKIDDVRRITNKYKGTLAKLIAKEAFHRGAIVKLLMGDTGMQIPSYLPNLIHHDYQEYVDNVLLELGKGFDWGVFSAAVADYAPNLPMQGKIPSGMESLKLELPPTKKVIELVREKYPSLMMATFKVESGLTVEELLDIANERSQRFELVVANRTEDMVDGHRAYIVHKNEVLSNPQSKQEIAESLISAIVQIGGG